MLPFTTYNIPESINKETDKTEKWLWLLIDSPLNEESSALLDKISSALKADFTSNVNCIEVNAATAFSFSSLSSPIPKLVISFGILPSAVGVWIDLDTVGVRVMESYTFILTLSLSRLASNPNAKKDLWKSMQNFMDQKRKQN